MFKKVFLPFVLFLCGFSAAFSQCLMTELPLAQRIQSASVIFEGRVISQTSFWNQEHTLIYTANVVDVYKIFKGNISSPQVEVVTEGGIVGDRMHIVTPSLELNTGDVGIFFGEFSDVVNSPTAVAVNLKFRPYGSVQGFICYDVYGRNAHDVFRTYDNIQTGIYSPVISQLGKNYQEIQALEFPEQNHSSREVAPSISSFSPDPITAGTFSVLTINGSGFGTLSGSAKVEFKNADDGGASYRTVSASSIQSWTATQIQTWVPPRCGTGTIVVTDASGSTDTSSSTLTVTYSETNVGSGAGFQPDLVDLDGNGGITWQFNTNFNSNTPAVDAIKRAFSTWRCGTFVNFTPSGTTSIDCEGDEGTNVIAFDNNCQLSAGVLGTSSSYYSACFTGGTHWSINGNDLKFDDATNWNYGPGATAGGQFDFQSVATHESGHSHQLGHIISFGKVMHYAISGGTDIRILDAASDVGGGSDVMSRSIVGNPCGPSAMTAVNSGNCNLITGIPDDEVNNFITLKIYPNPFREAATLRLTGDNGTGTREFLMYDVMGREVLRTEISGCGWQAQCETEIHRDNLPAGMYFYQLLNDRKILAKGKLIVQ